MALCLNGVRGPRAVQERVSLSAAWSLDSQVMHPGDVATVACQLFDGGAPDLGQVSTGLLGYRLWNLND